MSRIILLEQNNAVMIMMLLCRESDVNGSYIRITGRSNKNVSSGDYIEIQKV